MMRLKTKGLSLALAACMVFAMALPVQASGPSGTDIAPPGGSTVSGEEVKAAKVSGGDAGTEPGTGDDGTVSGGDETGDPEEDLSGKTVNLALIIDRTGSMGGLISEVVENLAEFVRFIESTKVNFRLSLIDYRDITCGEETMVHTFDRSVWSQSTEQLIAEMETLYADGGGDEAETLIDALGYLVDESVMTFNSDAAKFAIVLTDAPYKVDNTHDIGSMEDMIAALQEKGIKVSVMTNTWCFSEYEDLTSATGGILCSVYNFSEALREYAMSIIRAAADSTVDDSVNAVKGISTTGPGAVYPNYVYAYHAAITPETATDKGVYWYTEDNSVAEVIAAEGTDCYVRGVSEGTTQLTAVSRDGGYTSSVSIEVSCSAPISDSIISYDYDSIREALGQEAVKTYEYRLTDGTLVTDEQQEEIFSAIKGKEKTFTMVFSDSSYSVAYKWSFLGTKITDEKQAIDFGIIPDAGNETVLGAVKEDVAKMDIHFYHDGQLPGEAIVSVPVKDIFATDSLYLYYYDPITGGLELSAEGVAVVDGYASFPLRHCSDYILTSEMLRSLVPDLGADDTENNFGDDDDGSTDDSGSADSGSTGNAGSTDSSSTSNTGSMDSSTSKPDDAGSAEPVKKEDSGNTVPSKSPRTGDDSRSCMLFMLLVLSVSGVLVWGRKTPGRRFISTAAAWGSRVIKKK